MYINKASNLTKKHIAFIYFKIFLCKLNVIFMFF